MGGQVAHIIHRRCVYVHGLQEGTAPLTLFFLFLFFSNVCVSITYGWRRWEGEYSPFLTPLSVLCVS